MKDLNKYGQTAIDAVTIYKTTNCPKEAWKLAISKTFSSSLSSQEKGCPKSAFLGLCEDGWIKGIPEGNYTRSAKNKKYAIQTVKFLKKNSDVSFSTTELWETAVNNGISHNSQMDVVLALWEKGFIN